MRATKVTLYIRERGTQKYKKAKRAQYPEGTIFVVRYAVARRRYKWETLKTCNSYPEAELARRSIELDLLRVKVDGSDKSKHNKKTRPPSLPAATVKSKEDDPQDLDVLLDKYLSRGEFEGIGKAAEKIGVRERCGPTRKL